MTSPAELETSERYMAIARRWFTEGWTGDLAITASTRDRSGYPHRPRRNPARARQAQGHRRGGPLRDRRRRPACVLAAWRARVSDGFAISLHRLAVTGKRAASGFLLAVPRRFLPTGASSA